MSVVIDGTTGVTAAAFDGAVDAADLTGNVAAARITGALNASGSAPIYACRAWVNFNGTGTVAIRASGNVSSITDNGTGDYTINFTTAMPDANYSFSGATSGWGTSDARTNVALRTSADQAAASIRIISAYTNGSGLADYSTISLAIFR